MAFLLMSVHFIIRIWGEEMSFLHWLDRGGCVLCCAGFQDCPLPTCSSGPTVCWGPLFSTVCHHRLWLLVSVLQWVVDGFAEGLGVFPPAMGHDFQVNSFCYFSSLNNFQPQIRISVASWCSWWQPSDNKCIGWHSFHFWASQLCHGWTECL